MAKLDEEMDDVVWGSGRIIVMTILGAGLAIAILTTGQHMLRPWWNSMEAHGTEHGYVATSSKKELLLKLHQNWTELETLKRGSESRPEMVQAYTAQQEAIVRRMKVEASSLNTVPPEVRKLMDSQ